MNRVKNSNDRITRFFNEIASFSSTDSGVTRLPFTEENGQFIKYLIKKMNELGKKAFVDKYGNVFSVGDSDLKSKIIFASHYDSVPVGGKYDGIAGVVFGLLLLDELKGTEAFDRIEVAAFNCEESSRFGSASLGSKGFLNLLNTELCLTSQLETNLTFLELLENADYSSLSQVDKLDIERFSRFIEVHIEQSDSLHNHGNDIGLVKTVAGHKRVRLIFEGKTGHSSLLEETLRRDALLEGAKVILKTKELSDIYHKTHTVGTVTRIENSPNVMNMIPGKTVLCVDIRGSKKVYIEEFADKLIEFIESSAKPAHISFYWETISENDPAEMDFAFIENLERQLRNSTVTCEAMDSQAWHDIAELSSRFPSNLIFISNPSGKSHSVEEEIDIEVMGKLLSFFKEILEETHAY